MDLLLQKSNSRETFWAKPNSFGFEAEALNGLRLYDEFQPSLFMLFFRSLWMNMF